MSDESAQKIRTNPFYVLGLRPDVSRTEVERQGSKLLGMLELNLKSVQSYQTPLGPMPRTAELVRQAMAELRDPSLRLGHELWARLDPARVAAPPVAERDDDLDRRRALRRAEHRREAEAGDGAVAAENIVHGFLVGARGAGIRKQGVGGACAAADRFKYGGKIGLVDR